MHRFRPRRPSHGTVVGYMALFVALGGTAYAVTEIEPNSVGTKHLKANAVKSPKIANGTIQRIDAQAGAFATPQQLAGRLPLRGTAANAAKLGGIVPSGFLKGNGRVITSSFDVTADDDVLEIPGGGEIVVQCAHNSGWGVEFKAEAGTWDVYKFLFFNTGDGATIASHSTATQGGGVNRFPFNNAVGVVSFDVRSATGRAAVVTVHIHFVDATNDRCVGRTRGFVFPG